MSLINAVKRGDLPTVRRCLEEGQNPNLRDYGGKTVLMWASTRNHGNVNIVSELLKAGADVNLRDDASPEGFTPLICAVIGNYVDIVYLLLANGADVNLATHHEVTPLQHACRIGNPEIVKLLLKAGADVNHPGYEKFDGSPLTTAAAYGYKEIVSILLEAGADPNMTDQKGQTALVAAAKNNNIEIVRVLLKAGADPSIKDKKGRSVYDLSSDDIREYITKVDTMIKLMALAKKKHGPLPADLLRRASETYFGKKSRKRSSKRHSKRRSKKSSKRRPKKSLRRR
jgi:ankyrin repeat protein